MKYLWVFVILGAVSAFGQNAYGPDYINLHCTAPDPAANPAFGNTPRPGLAPTISSNGSAVIYCDAPTGTLKASFNGGSYGSVSGASGPGNTTVYYLSQNCGGLTNCTQIFGDTKFIIDATSNSTTTITCPNNDCNFTQADVGKTIWATTQGSGSAQFEVTNLVCPQTTIQTVNSAQNITVGTACTANGTANVDLIWGHNDGPTLHALDGNGTGCVTIQPFSGAYIMVDQAEFITPPTCAVASGSLQPLYSDRTWSAIVANAAFIMTPNFNWATCTGASRTAGSTTCFMSGMGQANDLFIWGTGLTSSTNANCSNANGKTILAAQPNLGSFTGLNVAGICAGTTGKGVLLDNLDEFWNGGGAQYVLTQPCVVQSVVFTQVLDCRADTISGSFGLSVNNGGYDNDISSWPIVGAVVFTGGTLNSRGSHFGQNVGACALQIQGTWISQGDLVSVDTNFNPSSGNLCFSAGGSVQSSNTIYNGSAANAIQLGGGQFVSLGGNVVTGPIAASSAPTGIIGWDVLQGSCTGTVASASTIGLYLLGNNTTTTCTSTTTNLGPTLGKAGNVYAMACYAGTAGNQAADACTVLKNNVATSMTCSLNAATFCTDGATAHQFTYAIGDIITVKIVSGTATTLANVKASVLAW